MLLECCGISKTFTKNGHRIHAIVEASLTLKAGEFKAIQGSSGSGKTTLLLTAGGLLHPDAGMVKINGTDLFNMKPEERALIRAHNIGFVFQQYHLIPYLTVLENILSSTLVLRSSGGRDRALELGEHFGLKNRIYHVPAELSSGEKQRTALARALLLQPKILLADEITGNLDRENSQIVLDYLREFANSGGAILMATHNEWAAESADASIVLKNGMING